MSHITTRDGLAIRVPESIANAVAMLQSEGKNIELLTDAVPRMYNHQQEKDVGICDFVIKVKSGSYDLGLKWIDDEKGFEAIYDTFLGHIAKELGITDRDGIESKDVGQMCIAKFMEAYNADMVINEAAEQGYTDIDYSYTDEGLQLTMSPPEEELAYA